MKIKSSGLYQPIIVSLEELSPVAQITPELLFEGAFAKDYEYLKLICPAALDMSRRVAEFVANWRPPEGTGSLEVLELGSGTGITAQLLLHSRKDLRITSIDNSATMLEQARSNLANSLTGGRLRLLEVDALGHLAILPAASLDIVASGYTLHNFFSAYRTRVIEEIHRVLKPCGIFVNGDRYALDDHEAHLRLIQEEVRGYCRVFRDIDRLDLLEQWIVHLFSDESPDHVMRLAPSLESLQTAGFAAVNVHHRDGVNALVTAVKPCQ